MAEKKFRVDEDVKQINLFDERFYNIRLENGEERDIFNVTGWLEAFPKWHQFKQWLMNTKDPDAVRDEAAQIGSYVHHLIERTLLGDTVKWEEGITKLEVWERFLGWCNFWKDLQENPKDVLGLKIGKKQIKSVETVEQFTEFITYDLDYGYAGTVDKMIKLVFDDDGHKFIVLDWKSGNNIYDTSYIQVVAYIKSVQKQLHIKNLGGFIVQVNPSLNKKGYRVYEVTNIDGQFEMFLAAQTLYRGAFGEPKPKYKSYPTEINLDYIKNNPIIKEVK